MKFFTKQLLMLFLMLVTWGVLAHAQSTGVLPQAKRIGLTLVDNKSVYTTVGEKNDYENTLRLNQPDGPYKLTAGLLNDGANNIILHRTDTKNGDNEIARINLDATITKPQSSFLSLVDFYNNGSNLPSSQTTITQAMLPANWGTNGTNLIRQTNGYAYISGQGGLTFTVPAGYSNVLMEFDVYVGTNARGGYFAYNHNGEGWSLATSASAGSTASFFVSGVNSGDVISIYGGINNSNQYQLYQSPDIAYINAYALPSSYASVIEVTPTISYKDGENWGTETALGSSKTYLPNDEIDLYGLGIITDQFSESTADNLHPKSYSYQVMYDANIIMPNDGSSGNNFMASADFTVCSTTDPASGTLNGYNGWEFHHARAYSSSGIISCYIQYYGSILFTMPDTFNGTSVNVTVTSSTGTDGAGILFINGEQYTFTAGETHVWTVPVTANGTIEFRSDGQTYSVDIANIMISSGNSKTMETQSHNGGMENTQMGKTNQPVTGLPIDQGEKERNINVKIND